MTRDEFDALVRRLETSSQRNPRLFLTRAGGLVALAYGYLALVLLGSLAACAVTLFLVIRLPNAATIKLGLIGLLLFGGIFWAILRGLWVRLEPPEGRQVGRGEAPKLFTLLDELRAALNCEPFYVVLLVPEHNAAVVQIPRLGILGWHRNYLLLGLPLLQSLSPDEFKAVLAHEFAHSSRGHGRFGNWLYRVRRSWDRIFEQMARQGTRGGFLLGWFIKWFWPIFNGHAFVLARANEYEADACAARIAGPDAAASALMRLPVAGTLLSEKFWPDIFARANSEQEPPAAVMQLQAGALKSGAAPEDAARWLKQAFLIETNNGDTHPCLKDRLRALNRLPAGVTEGQFPPPPPPPVQTAADFFLGSHAEAAARQLSEEWHKSIAPNWKSRHERTAELSKELAELDQPSTAPPTPAQLWKKALKLVELHDEDAASPVLDQLLALDPRHAGANFFRGRQYLEKDDPRGIAHIETALASDPALTMDGCNVLYGHYGRTGQRDKLRALEDRVDKFQELAAEAQRERANVTAKDTFLPPELKPEQIEALQKIFAMEADVASAAVVRKQVRLFPQNPCFVIGLRLKSAFWKFRDSGTSQKLVDRVVNQIKLDGNFLVFTDEQNLKSLGKKVFALPGAVVYERPAGK